MNECYFAFRSKSCYEFWFGKLHAGILVILYQAVAHSLAQNFPLQSLKIYDESILSYLILIKVIVLVRQLHKIQYLPLLS